MTATAMIARPSRGDLAVRRMSTAARAIIAMLKGSMVVAHAALLACIGIGIVVAGPVGGANAAIGGALVIFFYAAGQGVQLLASDLEDRTAMGVLLTSYAVRVVLMGLLLAAAMRWDRLDELFRPAIFFGSVVAVLVAWLAGMFVTHSRLRIPAVEALPRDQETERIDPAGGQR